MNDEQFQELLEHQESRIRRFYAQQRQLRAHQDLLERELIYESQLLEESPELAPFIHQLNTLETQAQNRGFINNIFPGL